MPVVLQNRQRLVAIDRAWLRRTAEAILSAARADGAELSLVLVSDRRMRALNKRYRNKDRTTDVLAFPLTPSHPSGAPIALPTAMGREGEGVGGGAHHSSPTMLLGDVAISMETARRQASEFGHSLRDEVARLLVHGVLHLLGYDHERGPRDAALMARQEKAILKTIG